MPNNPLQTFRAVEGANSSFTGTVTLASQPFVLHQQEVYSITAADTAAVSKAAFTLEALSANRFLPWLLRDLSSCYSVKVPNAYNRIYVFPMFFTSTDDTTAANMPTIADAGSYVAPYVIPFGMFPETRGHTTANKLHELDYRFPDDVVTAATPTQVPSFSTRTRGIWTPLPSFGLNSTNSNGTITTASTSTGYARGTVGAGAGYALPDDLSVSLSNTSALTASASQYVTDSTTVLTGMGLEFSTLGCEEIAVALGSNPAGMSTSIAAKVVGKVYKTHFALMGVFLG
jgi:hypothetical protein